MSRPRRPPVAPRPEVVPPGTCVACGIDGRSRAGEDYALPARRPLPWWPDVERRYRVTLCDQCWMAGVEEGIGLVRAPADWPLTPRFPPRTPYGACAECWYSWQPDAGGERVRVGQRVVRLCRACQARLRAAGWVVAAVVRRS